MTAKKKIFGALGGVAALGATVALTAGTFSYFSDSGSQESTVEFGTLGLSMNEGAAQPFEIVGAAPGTTVIRPQAVSFGNTGDLQGELRIGFVSEAPAGATAEEQSAFEDALLFSFVGILDNKTYTLAELEEATQGGLRIATLTGEGDPEGYDTKGFQMTVAVDPTAGNILQGFEGGFTLEADLVQGDEGGIAGSPAPDFPAAPVTTQS
jgi:hypothetical protein